MHEGRSSLGRGPVIQFDHTEHDFGEADAGEDVTHVFHFRNVEDEVLRIEKVRTSCGCTGALVSEKDAAPGGTGEIEARFRTRGYRGPVQKSLTVESSDPRSKQVRLTIRRKVLSEFTIEPRSINWGTVRKGDVPWPVESSIQGRKGKRLAVKEARSDSRAISLKRDNEKEDEVVYSVVLAKNLPVGNLSGRIFIETNSEKSSRLIVPFYALVHRSCSSRRSFGARRPTHKNG